MADESCVIRLPRTDLADEPILVYASRKTGGQTLDLDLLATDGASAYRAKGRRGTEFEIFQSLADVFSASHQA